MTGTAEAVKDFGDSMRAGMEGCADRIALLGRTAAHKKFDRDDGWFKKLVPDLCD
jgi:hypothetical protein